MTNRIVRRNDTPIRAATVTRIAVRRAAVLSPRVLRITVSQMAAHAITGAVFESFYGQASRGELAELPCQLPLLTYLATAPFIGPQKAVDAVERLSERAVRAASA